MISPPLNPITTYFELHDALTILPSVNFDEGYYTKTFATNVLAAYTKEISKLVTINGKYSTSQFNLDSRNFDVLYPGGHSQIDLTSSSQEFEINSFIKRR